MVISISLAQGLVDCSSFFSPVLLKNLTLLQKQEVSESLVSMILEKGGNHENYPLSCRLRNIVKVDPELAVLFSKSSEITDVVFKSLGIRIPENLSACLGKKSYQQALWDVVLGPQEFLNNIGQYDILDTQSYFDIFYIILEELSDKYPKQIEESFCRMIDEARILDPAIVRQAAIALAVVDGAAVFLEKHNMSSYEETIAVLKDAVCFERFSVKTLQQYPFLQEEDIVDIFKMSLEVDDHISLQTIKSLNITSSQYVYRLACLILDIDPRLFVMGFNSYFCPADQIDRMNLGVHLALNAPEDLSSVIRKLDLTVSQRKWLAKMVILSGASEPVININEFNLLNKHEIECLEIARKISPKLVYEASRKTRQKCYSNPDLRRESARLSLYRFLALVGSGNHYNLNDIYDFFSLDKSNLIFEENEIREDINKDNIYQVCLELYVANYGNEFFLTSDGEKVFKEISSYRNRQMASYLLHELACQLDIEEYLDVYMDLASSNSKMNIHKILPSILIAKWISEMDDPELQEEHVEKVKDCFQLLRDSFRDCNTFVMARLLSALEIIDGNIFLSFEKKIELVGRICALIDPKDKVDKKINTASFMKALNCVIALGSLKAQQKFFNLDFSEDINIDLHQLLQEILVEGLFKELPSIENFVDKFRDTFGLTRVPNALEMYMQKINKHGEKKVRDALQDFIVSVLNGTFAEIRYETEKSLHLKTLQQIDPAVFEAWKVMPQKLPIEASLKDGAVDYRKVFMFSCLHKHWHIGGDDLLPELTLFLERGIKTPGCDIVYACETLFNSSLDNKKQAEYLDIIYEYIQNKNLPYMELENDLEHLKSRLVNKAKFSSVFVQRSVDWQDLFLCGTEVGGSCQRVDGEEYLNKCLLAYCLDGKNSLIAVKDPQGKILARRIFRLLINTDSNRPVLFLDTLYPSGCKTEYSHAIMSMAKSEAARLGIDLLVMGEDPSLRYPGKVKSLGGRCPYEYADGSGGISLNSVFSIDMPQQI